MSSEGSLRKYANQFGNPIWRIQSNATDSKETKSDNENEH